MKLFLAFYIVTTFVPATGICATDSTQERNSYVGCTAALTATSIRPGDTTRISFTFSPLHGVHINTDPSIDLEFEKSDIIDSIGPLNISADTSTGYLLVDHPVFSSMKFRSHAPPGKYTLRGIIKYFYCSDEKGWCNRFSQPFSLTVHISTSRTGAR